MYRGAPPFAPLSWLNSDKPQGHGYNNQAWQSFAKHYQAHQGHHQAYSSTYGYPPTPPDDTGHNAAAQQQQQQQQAAAIAAATVAAVQQHQEHPMSTSPMPQAQGTTQPPQLNSAAHGQQEAAATGARMTPDRLTGSPAVGSHLNLECIKTDPSVSYPSSIFGSSFGVGGSKTAISISPTHNTGHPAGYSSYPTHSSMDFSSPGYSGFYPGTSMFGKPFGNIPTSAVSPNGDKNKNAKRNSAGKHFLK